MTNALFHAALAALVGGMAGMDSAVTTSRPQQGNPAVTQSAKTEQAVTIVGCLVHGNPSDRSGDLPSETGSAHENDYFLRTPAIQVPVGTTVAVGSAGAATSGTSGSGATTSAGTPDLTTLYRITGLDDERLRPHIGHRVELQGRLSADGIDASGDNVKAKTTVDATGRATTRVERKMDLAGELRATAIKMIGASCP
jgi:hypothetical protein